MNKKSAKLNLFFPFFILVAIVASIMIGDLVSTLENWAYRNWVNLCIFILMILFGLILIILVPLGLYSYSSKKLGIKIKNFEDIYSTLIITVLLTSFFRGNILKVTSMAGSSPQDFLTFVGSYLGLFVLIGIYFKVFHWAISLIKNPKLKMTKKSNPLRMTKKIKNSFKKRWPQIKEGMKITAWVATIIVAIFIITTTYEVRESILRTKPDLRAIVRPMLMEKTGGGHSGIGDDSCTLYYHDKENIEYLKIDVDIFNIGSGVAYEFDVKLNLPGLKYSQMEEDGGVSEYVDGDWRGTTYHWTDNFYYSNITLAPQGSKMNLRLNIPFGAIGSIENLPKECIITITDIDEKILLKRTWNLNYSTIST